MNDISAFADLLHRAGLNLVGGVPAALAADLVAREPPIAALAGVATLVVCGSGGRAHWEALRDADRRDPHPIDTSGRQSIEQALGVLGPDARLLSAEDTAQLDLRSLAALAGFGCVSPYLHMVIHPTFGPWVSIRGVVRVGRSLALPTGTSVFDPCTPCERPCLEVCPVGAFAVDLPWDFAACSAHRVLGRAPREHCDDGCHARSACVIGRQHAYSPAEYRHRHQANLPDIRRWLESS